LRLSGRSGFPVVQAFRQFRLSGPFGYSRVVLVTENKINLKRGRAPSIRRALPIVNQQLIKLC
jgi:hypothetical protein